MNLVGELIIGKSMLNRALTEFDQKYSRDPIAPSWWPPLLSVTLLDECTSRC